METNPFELSFVNSKPVIKQIRPLVIADLVPVRETLNSIDFLFGDDDKWEYQRLGKGWQAVIKVRLKYSEDILHFINGNYLKRNSLMDTYISDLTRVFTLRIDGKDENSLRKMDKDNEAIKIKQKCLVDINAAIEFLNYCLADL